MANQEQCSMEVHRDISVLEGKVISLEERLAFLNAEVLAMRKDMREMLEIMHKTQGSWKTLVALGGMVAAIVAIFSTIAGHLKG